jgi:hypothetical protein
LYILKPYGADALSSKSHSLLPRFPPYITGFDN